MPERIHMSHEEFLAQMKARALEVILQAQRGDIGLLLAVREVHGILWGLAELEKTPKSADLLLLKGVSSECDEWPLGSERLFWAPASLQAKDEQIDRYTAKVRDEVFQAFVRISDDLNGYNKLPG
jgi:hypothetical protein